MKKVVIGIAVAVALMMAFAAPALADLGGDPNENSGFGQWRSARNGLPGAFGKTNVSMRAKDLDDDGSPWPYNQGPGASDWVGRKHEDNTDRDHPKWEE